jgi:hypothetical protein
MSNPVVHFEIGCRDMAVTEQFYAKMFDWKMTAMGPAVMIDSGSGGIAGHITALDGRGPAGGAGSFAWFADPEGNMVGPFKPK